MLTGRVGAGKTTLAREYTGNVLEARFSARRRRWVRRCRCPSARADLVLPAGERCHCRAGRPSQQATAARDSLGGLPAAEVPGAGHHASPPSLRPRHGHAASRRPLGAHPRSRRLRRARPTPARCVSTGVDSYYFDADRAPDPLMENRPDHGAGTGLVARRRARPPRGVSTRSPSCDSRRRGCCAAQRSARPRARHEGGGGGLSGVDPAAGRRRAARRYPGWAAGRRGRPTVAAATVDEFAATAPPYFDRPFSATRAMLVRLGRAARESVAPGKLIKFGDW